MSKLFKCSVNWQDNNSEPSYGTDSLILAADTYVAAAERLVEYYEDGLAGYAIYELENPCSTEEL